MSIKLFVIRVTVVKCTVLVKYWLKNRVCAGLPQFSDVSFPVFFLLLLPGHRFRLPSASLSCHQWGHALTGEFFHCIYLYSHTSYFHIISSHPAWFLSWSLYMYFARQLHLLLSDVYRTALGFCWMQWRHPMRSWLRPGRNLSSGPQSSNSAVSTPEWCYFSIIYKMLMFILIFWIGFHFCFISFFCVLLLLFF